MITVLCCDGYGSMLWNLQSASAESYFKSWNTCVKLLYEVPRSTYTYLVEGFLAKDQTSLRNQILSRYPGFYTKLLNSPSKEIRMLVRMVTDDPRSTTCQNLRYIRKVTALDNPENYTSWRVREVLPHKCVPDSDKWRLGLLTNLMTMKATMYIEVQDSQRVRAIIDSLCSK